MNDITQEMGRLEIHVKRVTNLTMRGKFFAVMRADIDDRTYGMLSTLMPLHFNAGAQRTAKNKVGFRLIHGDIDESHSIVIVSKRHVAHTVFSERHAMLMVEVPLEVYEELREIFDRSGFFSNYEVEFDFEPLARPRNYGCIGQHAVTEESSGGGR